MNDDLRAQIAAFQKQLAGVPKEMILAEVEDLIRTAPASMNPETAENQAWIGRLMAALGKWDPIKSVSVDTLINHLNFDLDRPLAAKKLTVLLHAARASLRMDTGTPLSVAVGTGDVFEYFDVTRKVIEAARKDILFIDPYLDAEFVSRYLPHVAQGVLVRLLASRKLATLLSAAEQFSRQHGITIAVRSASGIHDRYVLVDGANCYQSGASFKDGAKKAPTTFTEITDAFAPVRDMYESMWAQAKVER
jgi:hypothetical protein